MKTFKHSGDLGDIIYSLATIKRVGGGILYLDITGGADEPIINAQCIDRKTRFNKDGFNFIKDLILHQPYITDVRIYKGEKVDYNFNNFRINFANPSARSFGTNLLEMHLEVANQPAWDDNEGWLTVDKPIKNKKTTIVARSPRMQASHTWYESNKFNLQEKAIFVGLPKEHEYFEWSIGLKIDYIKTNTALELAQIIAGSKYFISNSTFALSIAIGLGNIPIGQEVYTKLPTTVFPKKKNMIYI